MENYFMKIKNKTSDDWYETSIEIFPSETVNALAWENFTITALPNGNEFLLKYKAHSLHLAHNSLAHAQSAAEYLYDLIRLREDLGEYYWEHFVKMSEQILEEEASKSRQCTKQEFENITSTDEDDLSVRLVLRNDVQLSEYRTISYCNKVVSLALKNSIKNVIINCYDMDYDNEQPTYDYKKIITLDITDSKPKMKDFLVTLQQPDDNKF